MQNDVSAAPQKGGGVAIWAMNIQPRRGCIGISHTVYRIPYTVCRNHITPFELGTDVPPVALRAIRNALPNPLKTASAI